MSWFPVDLHRASELGEKIKLSQKYFYPSDYICLKCGGLTHLYQMRFSNLCEGSFTCQCFFFNDPIIDETRELAINVGYFLRELGNKNSEFIDLPEMEEGSLSGRKSPFRKYKRENVVSIKNAYENKIFELLRTGCENYNIIKYNGSSRPIEKCFEKISISSYCSP